MDKKAIQSYLGTQSWIRFRVQKKELAEKQGTQRYLELLDELGQKPEWLRKFCGRLYLEFAEDCGSPIWKNPAASVFVEQMLQRFPYLFFLAEKEAGTLKLFAMLGCLDGQEQGDQLSLDKAAFEAMLQTQLKGIVLQSRRIGFSPERAEGMVRDVLAYFGITG